MNVTFARSPRTNYGAEYWAFGVYDNDILVGVGSHETFMGAAAMAKEMMETEDRAKTARAWRGRTRCGTIFYEDLK